MSLRIKNITIENFKVYEKLDFEVTNDFSIIIGENNIGKTTLFEVLLLWMKCYKSIIIPNKNYKFYHIANSATYVNFSDLYFLRATNDKDIFKDVNSDIKIKLTIFDNLDNREFGLEFKINRPSTIPNSYLRIQTTHNQEQFKLFSIYLEEKELKADDAIFIYQAKPISNILSKEPYLNNGQIIKKIEIGKTNEVLRNKIFQNKSKLHILNAQIKELFPDIQLSFSTNNDPLNDEIIHLLCDLPHRKVDISLMGSGFLQIVEIFSTLNYLREVQDGLNVLLIDEPDSHTHTKVQKKLIKELRKIDNTQTIIITHNDVFVSEAKENELYFLNKEVITIEKELKPLEIEKFNSIKSDLGGVILQLEQLNNSKKIIFVEGNDDEKYIEIITSKYNDLFNSTFEYDKLSFLYMRGRDKMITKLDHSKRVISQFKMRKQIGVVFDKDFSSLVVLQKLHEDAQNVFHNIDFTHSHAGYCIESVIFSDLIKLKDVLFNSAQVLGISCTKEFIEKIIDNYLLFVYKELSLAMSLFNNNMEAKFKSQQRNREENSQISYSDFYRDIIDISKINYILTKDLIEDFFKIYFQKIYFPEIPPINTPKTCEECFLFVLNNTNSQNFFDDLNLLINKLYQNI